ncbi:hypothetical protein F4861DRAFT_329976 [Xylaria intraflava]|nr:hypothetical protein F4861DRAFT_329976 [Xylaria intraflava]
MSGYSKVGTSAIYEAGDQRNYKDKETPRPERFEEGAAHSHLANDSKDERSIANRLANEQRKKHDSDPVTAASKRDPTLPARLHGNEPSKGARVDADLRAEEEAYLRRKGRA